MNMGPTAAALIIGNEILSGRTADANINVIARRMTDVGIRLQEVRVVRDEEDAIIAAVNSLREKYTYVFTTGGIGPTHDDITIRSIARAFSVPVERNADIAAMLKRTRGDQATDATYRMADYPKGAHLLATPEPIPPGCYIGNVYILAGIPNIMQVMLEGVIPLLEQGAPMHSQALDVMAGENKISDGFEEIQLQYPDLELGSYPFRSGERYGTSLVVRGSDPEEVSKAHKAVHKMVSDLGLEIRS